MAVELRALRPSFAAEVDDIDLSQPMDAGSVRTIWDAIDRYAVLVFHDQRLTDTQLRDFAAEFGPLEIGRGALQGGRRRLALPQIGDISNLDEENRIRARNDRRRLDSLGNRLWHTDASYMPVPVVLGMLHAVAVPPASVLGGGETEFADMRAAYDALPETMKAEIDGLVAEHDIFWSRGQIGFTEFPLASARNTHRRRSVLCGCIQARSAKRSTCPRMHRTSSAGRWPRGVCCCGI